MGFVGYNTSFYSQLTSEVAAWWLLEYVKGNLLLPSPSVIYQEMAADMDWMKTQYHSVVARGTCIFSFTLRYTEQLMEDMGANNQLGVWKEISQIMMPVDSSLYNRPLAKKFYDMIIRTLAKVFCGTIDDLGICD
ncbi:MAG: hypothetical protein V7K92_05835 [Nostoc sp.]|uniref:hypothetical protein n=1 Tax=Nostoc sp. TaxID=1180 RepID=UPI002FEFC9E9